MPKAGSINVSGLFSVRPAGIEPAASYSGGKRSIAGSVVRKIAKPVMFACFFFCRPAIRNSKTRQSSGQSNACGTKAPIRIMRDFARNHASCFAAMPASGRTTGSEHRSNSETPKTPASRASVSGCGRFVTPRSIRRNAEQSRRNSRASRARFIPLAFRHPRHGM